VSDVLSLEDARAAGIGGELGDEALQDAIDEEEAWLARRVGPLVGERTQRFALTGLPPGGSELRLLRPTDEVEVTLDAVALTTVELRPDQRTIARLPEGTRYTHAVEVTYTPNDELEVRRALKLLVGIRLGEVSSGGLQGEQMGSYSYQRGAGTGTRSRGSIVRDLTGRGQPGTTRIKSTVPHGLAGALGR
jgi:hypothetical protein